MGFRVALVCRVSVDVANSVPSDQISLRLWTEKSGRRAARLAAYRANGVSNLLVMQARIWFRRPNHISTLPITLIDRALVQALCAPDWEIAEGLDTGTPLTADGSMGRLRLRGQGGLETKSLFVGRRRTDGSPSARLAGG
jgi:hypothetical protein